MNTKLLNGLRYAAWLFVACLVGPACSVSTDGLYAGSQEPEDAAVVPVPDVMMPPPGTGTACAKNTDCASGFCAEGVCCDSPCSAGCSSCNLPDLKGRCSPIPPGMAPRLENACRKEATQTCGFDGTCDGIGGCRKHVQGTECGLSSCANNTEQPASKCDGAGTCVSDAPKPCAPYMCSVRACSTECRRNADCTPDTLCVSRKCEKYEGAIAMYNDSSPSVDGVGDDQVWSRVNTWLDIKNVVSGTVGSTEDLTARMKLMWTPLALFVLVEVNDSFLTNDSAEATRDDAVEIFLDLNRSKGETYDGKDDLQYLFGWNDNDFTETKLNKRQDVTWAIQTAGNRRSYTLEARFPWSTIAGPAPAAGLRIGFQVVIDDDDDGADRDAQVVWSGTRTDSATRPASFGDLLLNGP
ncbi:MAG: sugar-binding protein [Deltaproteobacteria bacterium]|nr:sugar-binding protein [Deltaproteobacteria bacterium]